MGNSTSYKPGHQHNPDTRKKIGDRLRGRKTPPEVVAKRVAARAGYKHSPETIEKIRIANTGKKKTPEQIEKHRQKMLGREPWNKGLKFSGLTRSDISKKWVENNKERRWEQARKSHLKKTFGITPEEYDWLFAKQRGRCAICGLENKIFIDKNGRRRPALYIDHCHKKAFVRGLLCQHCNTGLGYFKDSPKLLRLAADYLSLVP